MKMSSLFGKKKQLPFHYPITRQGRSSKIKNTEDAIRQHVLRQPSELLDHVRVGGQASVNQCKDATHIKKEILSQTLG